MKNPFQESQFYVTNDYLEISSKGLSKKITCVNLNGNSETRGIGILLIANRQDFSNHQEALTILIQYLLYEREGWDNFKDFTKVEIEEFTVNFLKPIYGKSELNIFSKEEFKKEYKSILDLQIEFAKMLPELTHIYKESWFGIKSNKEKVTNLTAFDPLEKEELETCFYFKNEWDSKEYFAISKNNYLYFDWFLSW